MVLVSCGSGGGCSSAFQRPVYALVVVFFDRGEGLRFGRRAFFPFWEVWEMWIAHCGVDKGHGEAWNNPCPFTHEVLGCHGEEFLY